MYNILERSKVEFEFTDLIKTSKLRFMVWSSLVTGLLIG